MFRYRSGIRVSYDRQGYVYFTSRLYREMSPEDQKKIENLCRNCAGQYGPALLELVTTNADMTWVTQRYHVSKSTMLRCLRRYYERFPGKL